ncbi:hypothetical protein D3C72_252780 [compost metagenome]
MATGPIGHNDTRAAMLAAQRRAQEAARKAAEEARRKAAEEAARKAAEEAKKKAAEEARKKAAEEAKKKAAEEAQKKAAAEKAEKANKADKAEKKDDTPEVSQKGAAEELTNRGLNKTLDKALKKPAKPIEPDEAKIEQKGVQDDISKAKTPEDVKKAADRSKTLNERIKATEDPRIDKKMRQEIGKTDDDLQKANKAVAKLESSQKALEGSPEEKASETARLLSNPDEVKGAIKDLSVLKESPVAEKLEKDVKAIAEKADPEALSKQLDKEPDLSKYSPEMAGNLTKLRQAGDPKLNASIDKVATGVLNREGGLKLEDVKKNPALGQLVAPLQNSADPAVKGKVDSTVKAWAKESITENLKGKEKKEGAEAAVKGFQSEMADIANKTGLGAAIQAQGPQALEEAKGEIEDVAKKGMGFFEKLGSAVGDVVGGAVDFFDKGIDLVGEGVGFVGKTAGKAVDLLGDGIDFVADTTGKIQAAAIETTGHLVGEGLEALGAEDMGKAVKSGSKQAADIVKDVADQVGNVANSFVDGVGGALEGTTDGLQFIIQEPVQAAKGFYTIGKAVVTGDTDTLKAVGKALVDEAFVNPQTGKFDIAYGTGYVAANVIPMLVTGGGSSAATGANASSKFAKVGTFAARADQVMDGARALQSLDVAGVVNSAKALKAPLAAGDDLARLGRTKAFLKNPKNYAQNYASHLKSNALVTKGQLRQTLQGLKETATNALQNPGQAAGDLAKQVSSNAKKTRLTTKLAAKSAVRGLKTRDMAQFQKAVEFMNKNPLVQGINSGITRGTKIAEIINDPLKPIADRFGTMVNKTFENYTRAGQRSVETVLDATQEAKQQQELAKK